MMVFDEGAELRMKNSMEVNGLREELAKLRDGLQEISESYPPGGEYCETGYAGTMARRVLAGLPTWNEELDVKGNIADLDVRVSDYLDGVCLYCPNFRPTGGFSNPKCYCSTSGPLTIHWCDSNSRYLVDKKEGCKGLIY